MKHRSETYQSFEKSKVLYTLISLVLIFSVFSKPADTFISYLKDTTVHSVNDEHESDGQEENSEQENGEDDLEENESLNYHPSQFLSIDIDVYAELNDNFSKNFVSEYYPRTISPPPKVV